MKIKFTDVAITVGWAIVVASIILRALYSRSALTEVDLVLLFLSSAVVGSALVDVEIVVLSFVGAIALTVAVAYFCLTLPSILQIAGAASGAMYESAILMIFRSIFPIPLVVILFGGFLGSVVGERLNLR